MPFTKTGPDQYTSPSGRKYNAAQVRLYYAGGGRFPGEKPNSAKPKPNSVKPARPASIDYAAGLRRG